VIFTNCALETTSTYDEMTFNLSFTKTVNTDMCTVFWGDGQMCCTSLIFEGLVLPPVGLRLLAVVCSVYCTFSAPMSRMDAARLPVIAYRLWLDWVRLW